MSTPGVNPAPQTGETVCFAEFTPDFAVFASIIAALASIIAV